MDRLAYSVSTVLLTKYSQMASNFPIFRVKEVFKVPVLMHIKNPGKIKKMFFL
jgi:hypothetical protein